MSDHLSKQGDPQRTRIEQKRPGATAGIEKQHHRPGGLRLGLAALSLAGAFLLGACGGGGYDGPSSTFNIGVSVGGALVSQTPVAPGGSIDLSVLAGQSVDLDAGEPAIWTMYVGGSAISGGVQVFYAGVYVTATTLSPSAVGIDTFAPNLLPGPVPVTLVATSTYDAAQVATVNLLISN